MCAEYIKFQPDLTEMYEMNTWTQPDKQELE